MNKLKKIITVILIVIFSIFNTSEIIPNYNLKAYSYVNPFSLRSSITQTQIINGVPINVTVYYFYSYNNFIKTVTSISSVSKSISDSNYKGTLVEFHTFSDTIITVNISGVVYERGYDEPKSIYGIFTFYIL